MRNKTADLDLWIKYLNPNDDAQLRLFCFPYAGGDINVFSKWPRALPEAVEVCPVQLPGRGPRLGEEPYRELSYLIPALADALFPHLTKPFALFGHSMGSLISFELARHLREHNAPSPVHLFVSGYWAPQLSSFVKLSSFLSDQQLLTMLRWSGRIPKEILGNDELMELMLPALRADCSVCRTYMYSHSAPLKCPITTFAGSRDYMAGRKKIEAWREQTNSRYRHYTIPGGHFFLHSSELVFLRVLSQELAPYVNDMPP